VVDSGIGKRSGKVVGKAGVKLCFVNRMKSWREITTEIFTDNTGLVKTIKAQEAAEKFVKTCKHCKAKKFTAKTGNVVCSNACWTAWGGKKKGASPKKKKSQTTSTTPPSLMAARKKAATAHKKKSQKKPEKKPEKIVAEILPGDLVTVEEFEFNKVTTDYTGKVLGIVMKVDQHGRVETNWTVDNSGLPEWDLPALNHYSSNNRRLYRFKVLSRKCEWKEAS
jgi:biotin carboxyl carrier protein